MHVLEGYVHASEAILAVASDPEGTVWHKVHQTAKGRQIKVASGQFPIEGVPPLRIRLVYYALNFRRLSPLKSWMKDGFYDVPMVSAFVLFGSCPAYVRARNWPRLIIERLREKSSEDPQLGHRLRVHFRGLAQLPLSLLQPLKVSQPTKLKVHRTYRDSRVVTVPLAKILKGENDQELRQRGTMNTF